MLGNGWKMATKPRSIEGGEKLLESCLLSFAFSVALGELRLLKRDHPRV